MSGPIPQLETLRLLLRAFRLADSDDVTRLAGAPEVAATTGGIPHPYPPEAATAWIGGQEVAAESGRWLTWAIEHKATEMLIGCITLRIDPRQQRGELAYWLGVPFWNQGYMTEAARRVLEFGFRERGLYRIEAMMLPRNVGSWRVVEKVGLQHEGRLRGYILKDGVFEDVLVYAVLQPEFEEGKSGPPRYE